MTAAAVSGSRSQPRRIVVAGASVRSLAASAALAGLEVHAIDLFGDRDLRDVAASWTCPQPYPAGVVSAAATLPGGPWVYTGGLENHPDVIAAITRHRPLAGCRPEAVATVRDPATLATALAAAGLAYPETRVDPAGLPGDGSWLAKPRRSAGGQRIAAWHAKDDASESAAYGRDDVVWQRRVAGRSAAVAYLIAAGGPRLVAASRQLVGCRWCQARPFRYCGSVDLDPECLPARLVERLARLGETLAGGFGLRGFVGVDLVIDPAGDPWVIEVNPRPTASLELIERVRGFSIAAGQLAAFGLGSMPRPRPRSGCWSKAILFARRDLTIDPRAVAAVAAAAGDPQMGWPLVADVPCPWQVIAAGRPVCTLFAAGPSPRASLTQLRRRTRAVAAALDAISPPFAVEPEVGRRETASGTRLRWSPDRSP